MKLSKCARERGYLSNILYDGVLVFILQIYKIFSNKKNPRDIFLFRGFVVL